MTSALTILILLAPFALAATLIWTARRSGSLRLHLDQFPFVAPMSGRLFDHADSSPAQQKPDTIRARFEQRPVWPHSGATGDRR